MHLRESGKWMVWEFLLIYSVAFRLRFGRPSLDKLYNFLDRHAKTAFSWSMVGLFVSRRHGDAPHAVRFYMRACELEPSGELNQYVVFMLVSELYKHKKFREVANTDISSCLDASDEKSKWVQEVHRYCGYVTAHDDDEVQHLLNPP